MNLCSEQRPGHLSRKRLAGNIFSAEEAYSYYEEQYGSEKRRKTVGYSMRCCFGAIMGKGRCGKRFELRRVSNGDIVYTCANGSADPRCSSDYDDFKCVFWENKLHGNCLGRFRQKV